MFKDFFTHPSTATTLALQKFGVANYIKEVRIVYDGGAPATGVFSLEGLFEAYGLGHTASVYTQRLHGLSTDWRFRTGTLPVTTLTTDPLNANWVARSVFPVGNGGSTLERLHIHDNKSNKFWSISDNGSATSSHLRISSASGSVMRLDGDLYKVSIGDATNLAYGITSTASVTDGTLRIFGGTNSNLLDIVQASEQDFKYRIRALATQPNMNPDMNRLGLGTNTFVSQVAYSSGLWYNNIESSAIKFWRGLNQYDGFLSLNTYGDTPVGLPLTGTVSD